MRIAVVSDIHGNLPALEAVCAQIDADAVDVVINLGDIASGPLWPAETCELLMARGWPTIRGNHERQVLGEVERMGWSDAQTRPRLMPTQLHWLGDLPERLTMAGGAVHAFHGTPASDLQYLLETVMPELDRNGSPGVRAASEAEISERLGALPDAAQLVLCGHTHMPRIAWHRGVLIVNPGSVGLPAFDDDRPYAHRMETACPHARWGLVERTPTGWQAQLIATAYDHEAAAQQAHKTGRSDWADALRTGRVGRTEAQARRAAAG